jgi:hypothetical protein
MGISALKRKKKDKGCQREDSLDQILSPAAEWSLLGDVLCSWMRIFFHPS